MIQPEGQCSSGMHGFVFPADLLKAVRSSPLTVGGRQDGLVGKGSGTAFSKRGESLIQTVPFHKTEYEQCIGQFPALISPFRRNHILDPGKDAKRRSEEHTSELQSRFDLVCRLLLEKKKMLTDTIYTHVC